MFISLAKDDDNNNNNNNNNFVCFPARSILNESYLFFLSLNLLSMPVLALP